MLTAMITARGLRGVSGCMGKHLSSAWGVLLPCAIILLLAMQGLNLLHFKLIIAIALLATLFMLFHQRLRHFLLLPSCVALAGGLVVVSIMFDTLG
ncbi:uncharacterized protein DUF1435|uniref:Uncharacterized protein DUF1435 n=1 Tax=Brenneria salicis ATCC 15712 = DSM 30166 TaxID=714314 RepID=A0A366I609_9GAMM|nr:DUF1435 domain-containing protein [Brenneria salicis]NMN92770.1 uncharacterized protein DUF1435 [Brenneria salicis ATCC 15712 = DSM 30166]RBP63747.1 uncharacterized protein DUF1435 [Brenneria salicis ATCC 15712 = DSM 30166]RLM31032.1 hypothetical protein BHG07_07460 [Brenneria salicis ATCC 15712 = DSM 30166]